MIVLRRLYSRRASSSKLLQQTKKDPGIFQQKKVLGESPEDIEDVNFDELESDFMNVHKSHRQHVRQLEHWREKEKYLIVKQKYFKEKYPNFLTWHDKEQIRYLYNTNPEEWSLQKLSEGFPASTEVIEKIIKGKWTKKNETKVSHHDRRVLQNWNDFKQGKLNNLPQELKEHLHKFTNRILNFSPFSQQTDGKAIVVQNETKNGVSGEFSDIITSFQRLTEKNAPKPEMTAKKLDVKTFNDISDTKFKTNNNHRLVTFKELQETMEKQVARGKDISMEDDLLRKASFPKKENATTIELRQEDISKIVEHKRETNNNSKVGFVRKTTRDMSHLIYPDKIVIPSKIYKKGYTYKLNDCYYDSDGEFLYRVPGMG